jgi:hypothetical protein
VFFKGEDSTKNMQKSVKGRRRFNEEIFRKNALRNRKEEP